MTQIVKFLSIKTMLTQNAGDDLLACDQWRYHRKYDREKGWF